MRIGILGAGNMAGALGAQWARAGHEVLVGARDRDKAVRRAAEIGPGSRAGGLREAAAFGEATLLAVAYEGVADVLGQVGDVLRGRTVIDCVNGIVHPGVTLATGIGPSVARRIADATGAHVVKAFNLCPDAMWRMTPPRIDGRPLTVPVCGDDSGALATARTLIDDLGCVPADAGDLDRAGVLEATAAYVIGLHIAGIDPRSALPPLS
ncbi:NADPH-dependent F420 reductase [Actinoallomurus rhizosphaericola]|uniref:NADPH-dependent F420 reductase n=1 Tax=Actinoallomurus rhizosphaericola TaxID=2952536 RepID=UPI0020931C46|nr:NAD(P)-binding domain-containing protein [Actinoallomurus rhizosphaericola]MCO5996593.1 NAD(P)-binding domain-containing protein [Actinoallomurus rhizosphaericola]